jgi:RNA polymerase sigma-70 factor (ECF subfamily)
LTTDDALGNEAALVAAAKRDPHAFAPLYRHYVDRVYGYCLRRLGTREAAEDATSRTFERALRQVGSCRDEAFRGWLFTIATHVIADHYRSIGQRTSLVSLDEALDAPDGALPVVDAAIGDEAVERLQRLLQHLPVDQQRVLELRAAGLKGTEIAAVLGRSPDAIRMLQLRAMRQLRKLLHADQLQEATL